MSEPPRHYVWEDFVYPPDVNGREVLRNKQGIVDFADAFNSERQLTGGRQFELAARPELVPRTFDTNHWKAIHRHVFQDVYEWAGQFRTVDIFRQDHGFAAPAELEYYAENILAQVRSADMFAGRDRAGVIDGLMYTMRAVNIIHPFREGNGRTQRILTEHIAQHAGYLLDWYRIDPDEQNLIMSLAYDDELGPLHDALERAVLPIFRGGALDESPWPTQPTGPARAPDFWRLTKNGTQVLTDARSQPHQSAQPNAAVPGAARTPEQPMESGR